MLEFLVDNIVVVFGGKVFQQIVGIPMDTICTPLLADIFLYSYKVKFMVFALNWTEQDSISVQLHIHLHRWRIVNQEPRFWELSASDVSHWAWDQRHDGEQHLCLLLGFTPVDRGGRSAAHFPLRQTWRFPLPYHKLSSNIPFSPANGVFISQLIRYVRACSSYDSYLKAVRLSSKLLGQGFVMERLKSPFRKFYGRYGDFIKHYQVSLSQMLHGILGHDYIQWHPQLIKHYTNLRTYYRTGPYYRFWPYYQILEVSIEHCKGCG